MNRQVQIPMLQTERLWLRQLHPGDVDDIYLLFSNPNVMKYDGGFVLRDKKQADEYIYTIGNSLVYENKVGITWAFIERKTGDFVGTGGIKNWYGRQHAEVGLVIAEQYWNRKFGREALQKIVQFAFEKLKLTYVYAATLPENKQAIRLVERLGFRFQGWNHHYWLANQYVQAMVFIQENPLYKKIEERNDIGKK
ncbi:GNAT family N-acetyltransferase [Pueribacillus sp. YX66]|uniref:GNAT family N-acetyltransferase n=1 Tax=Pueribacillus sp. YX66 TaxID=3229242 RepID=UPI00358D81B8